MHIIPEVDLLYIHTYVYIKLSMIALPLNSHSIFVIAKQYLIQNVQSIEKTYCENAESVPLIFINSYGHAHISVIQYLRAQTHKCIICLYTQGKHLYSNRAVHQVLHTSFYSHNVYFLGFIKEIGIPR